MPLNLLKKDRTIEYKGYNFISKLPDEAIPEMFEYLRREKRLIYEVSLCTLEVMEPFTIEIDQLLFAVTISKNRVEGDVDSENNLTVSTKDSKV